jgi:septal ring factor EnvC (AmiA/AmiB activator)
VNILLAISIVSLFLLGVFAWYEQQNELQQDVGQLVKNGLERAQQIDGLSTDVFGLAKKLNKLSKKLQRSQARCDHLQKQLSKQTLRLDTVHRQQHSYFRKRCSKSICPEKRAFWYTSPAGGTYRCCFVR